MIIVRAAKGAAFCIGRKGENLVREIHFDIAPFVDVYGDGEVQLLVQRPGDDVPYPVPLAVKSTTAVWSVTNTDTANEGLTGKCELMYYVGEKLAKSEVFPIHVLSALGDPADEAPDPPGKLWFEQMIEKLKKTFYWAGNMPTATDIGALPATKEKAGQYGITADRLNVYGKSIGSFVVTKNQVSMQTRKDEGSIARGLYVYNDNEVKDRKKAVQFVEDGVNYYIYGEHNKPTASDIGAASSASLNALTKRVSSLESSGGGMTLTPIWENWCYRTDEIGDSDFPAQTVTVDGQYEFYVFVFMTYSGLKTSIWAFGAGDGIYGFLEGCGASGSREYRNIGIRENSIKFYDAKRYTDIGGFGETDNYCSIPLLILGIK